jgi:hypothetical protein
MACRFCGGGDAWIKTVRDEEGNTFPICDPCYLVYRAELVIVPGPVCVHGKCLSCGTWMNARELVDVKPGAAGKGDAPGGTCIGCHEVAATEGGG